MLSSTTAQWCLIRLDSNYNSAVILIGSSWYSSESWDNQTLKQFSRRPHMKKFLGAGIDHAVWEWEIKVTQWGFLSFGDARPSTYDWWLFRRFKRKTMGWLMKKFCCWSFWGHWYMPEAVLLVVHYQRVIMFHFCISGLYGMSELKCKLKWKIKFSTKMEV